MGERQEGAEPFNPATHSSVQVSLERDGVASPFRHHLQQRGPELLFSTCTGPAEVWGAPQGPSLYPVPGWNNAPGKF